MISRYMFRPGRLSNNVKAKRILELLGYKGSRFLLFLFLGFSSYVSSTRDVRADDLYVSDNVGTIFEFNNGNRFTFATGLQRPTGIAFDPAGNLYVSESDTGIIYKFDVNGNRSIFASGLARPFGLTFDEVGNLYVADFGNSATPGFGAIVRFTPSGTASTFASGLYTPTDLAFDSGGNLFVSDYLAGIVYRFTSGGVGNPFATGLGRPFGLAIDATDNVFVANGQANGSRMITKFNQAGLGVLFAGGLDRPNDLTFDEKGRLFDANDGDYILEFDPDGNASLFADGLTVPGFLAFGPESNAVPEPSALALILAGIIPLTLARLRLLRTRKLPLILALAVMLLSANSAWAMITINANEVGSDVVFTLSGSLNTDSLDLITVIDPNTSPLQDRIIPFQRSGVPPGVITAIFFGSPLPVSVFNQGRLANLKGPSSYGPGPDSQSFHDSTNPGSIFAFSKFTHFGPDFGQGTLNFTISYTSLSPLAASMSFAGTFSSLGLTPGTYQWDWFNSSTNIHDSLVLQIGSVPEPSAEMLMVIGLAALVWLRRKIVAEKRLPVSR